MDSGSVESIALYVLRLIIPNDPAWFKGRAEDRREINTLITNKCRLLELMMDLSLHMAACMKYAGETLQPLAPPNPM